MEVFSRPSFFKLWCCLLSRETTAGWWWREEEEEEEEEENWAPAGTDGDMMEGWGERITEESPSFVFVWNKGELQFYFSVRTKRVFQPQQKVKLRSSGGEKRRTCPIIHLSFRGSNSKTTAAAVKSQYYKSATQCCKERLNTVDFFVLFKCITSTVYLFYFDFLYESSAVLQKSCFRNFGNKFGLF